MKLLGLLRHAKSAWDDVSLRDYDRGLTDRGRRGAAAMGEHIRAHDVAWDLLLASPAERVKRTLDGTGLKAPVRWDERVYLADPGTLIALLQALDDGVGAVLVAGHNPGLHELIFDLVAPENENALLDSVSEKLPTATYAVLELAIDRWADCTPGCGTLVHLARPRDLDPALGPEKAR